MIPSLVDIPENPMECGSSSTIRQQTEEKIPFQNKNSSSSKFDLSSIIQTRQTLNYVYETAKNYMRRGALNSDHLEQLMKSSRDWRSKLTQKDTMLMDILLRENVDLCAEENQNMTIYALRKKFKNELEINFLCNVVKNLAFFSDPSSVQSEVKDSSSFKKIINALSYRSVKKHEIIFNHGEKGKELYTVIKGSALCLIPDPSFKKKAALQPKKIEIIKEQQGETKAEGAARSFLNTLALGVNKKAVVDTNVKSFIDNLKTQYQTKIKAAPRGFLKRSSTRQLEEIIDDEEKKKANWTDSEFIKHYFPNFIHVKTFVPGESFGEIALLTAQGRTATLVSRENSEFLVLDKGGFEKAMDSMKKNVITEKIEFIKSFDFFSNITIKKVLQVLQQVRILRCEVKQSIYDEGNNSNFLFLIKEGEVELRSRYANPEELVKQFNIDNNEEEDANQVTEYEHLRKKKRKVNVSKMVTVKILGKGSYFGEEEIVKGLEKRQCQAICHSQDTEIFAIEKSKLQMMGFNIFDKLKDQVHLKEGMKEERLKNAIKIQIPQSDIQNLDSFMQKDKENKERQEQKERLKLELARKLKTNFQNRFEPNSQLDTTIEVTDSDLQDYNQAKAIESQRKAFSRMQFINLAPEPVSTSNNIMTILNPQINKQIQPKLNRQHDNQSIDEENNAKQRLKAGGVNSRNRIRCNSSNEEEEFFQMMGPHLQVKSFQNLLHLEGKPLGEEHNYKVNKPYQDDGATRQRSSGPSLLIRDESATSLEGLTQSPFQTALKQKKIVLHINKSRTSFHVLDSSSQNSQQQVSLASCRSNTSHRNNFSSINTPGLNQNQSCSYLTKYYVKPSVKSHQQSLQSTTYNNTNSSDGPLIFIEGEDSQEGLELQQSAPSRLVKVPRINLEKLQQKQQKSRHNSLESDDENYNIIPSSQRSQKSSTQRFFRKTPEEQIQEMESIYEQSEKKRFFEHSLLTQSVDSTDQQGNISNFLQTQSLENIKQYPPMNMGSQFKKNLMNLKTQQIRSHSRHETSPQKMHNSIVQSNTARGEQNPSFIVRNVPSASKEKRVHVLSPRNQLFNKLDKTDSKERIRIVGNFFKKERKTLKDIAPHETSNNPQKFIKNQPFQEAVFFQTGFAHFRANNQPSELNQQSIQLASIPKSESLIIKPTSIQLNAVRNSLEVKGKPQFESQQSQTSSQDYSQDIALVQYLKCNVEKSKMPDKFSTLPAYSSKDGNEKQQMRSMLRFRKTQANDQADSTFHKLQQSSSQEVFSCQPSITTIQSSLAPLSSRKDHLKKNVQTLH